MGFFGNLFGLSKGPREEATIKPFFVEVVKELGEEIAAAPHFEEHLNEAMKVAGAYFARHIGIIPGSLDLARANFDHDAVVSTLFHTHEDVRFALGRSIESREGLPVLQRAKAVEGFALVGMRCRETDQIPGHPPVFADHSLKCLATSEAEVRDAIANIALIRVLKTFAEHVEKLRRRGKLLRVEWNITNPHARGNNATDSNEFITAEKELTPDNLLRGLCAWLANPGEYLRIVPGGARVSIQKPDGALSILDLPVLHSTDRRQWFVCIVRFPVAECAEALATEARTHRYIYI
jgi:hypothetical protein